VKKNDNQDVANTRVLKKSVLIVVLMFGFGFALVPLYELCKDWLSNNGQAEKADIKYLSQVKEDKSRLVVVEFFSDVHSKLAWDFHAATSKVKIHPGKQMRIEYIAKNLTNKPITGLARFNIYPPEAGRYFKKTECFCFTEQTLKGGETKRMPLLFMVDPKLPKRIDNIVLTYEFLKALKKPGKKLANKTATNSK